jgi:anti-sigma factor RsiW
MKELAMDCHAFDWRGYGLGELPPAEMAECERHLGSCAQCRTELSRWQATLSAVRNLPQVEPPRRIVFVSDPILPEPWWRRMWKAGPQLGFASAAMLSLAIVTHGLLARPPAATAPAPQPGIEARIHTAAQLEVERRLPAAVDAAWNTAFEQRLQTELRPALAQLERQLTEREKLDVANYEQQSETKRQSDLKAVRYALETYERRLNFATLTASRRSGGD